MLEIPKFKYFFDPIKLGVIEKRKTTCPVCNNERDYQYIFSPYGDFDLEGICPWCIYDGSAYEKYDVLFNDTENDCFNQKRNIIKEEILNEVRYKTPSYATWQYEVWLDCCKDICAMKDYVGWKEIEHLYGELKDDILIIIDSMGMSLEEFKEDLVNEGYHQGYLYQCLHCKKHRLYTDVN